MTPAYPLGSLTPPACLLRPWAITELLFIEPYRTAYIHLLHLCYAVLKHLREVAFDTELESGTVLPLQNTSWEV